MHTAGHDHLQAAPEDARRLSARVTPALARGDERRSGAALAARGRRLAVRLQAQGLRAGQVVLCASDDPLQLLLLQHALVRAGAGLLPHAPQPRAALADLAAAVGAEWRWQQGTLTQTGQRRAATASGARACAPALLIRTSGTSGSPKVAMLTADQLLASAARVNAVLGLRDGDEWLCVLPLHHIGGLAIGWRCALARATVRLVALDAQSAVPAAGGFDAGRVAATLAAYPVTHLSLVPAMLARLLDVMPAPPPCLRVLLLGGQALHPSLASRAADAGWPLFVSYGMSETGSMVAAGLWRDDDGPGACIGSPLPGVAVDCAGGVTGEPGPPRLLRVRGPMLMAGYGNPARVPGIGLDDGWLTAPDLCRLDPDGALRVFGRADELVVIGGEQVSPGAVEARLAAAPGVREVAVVALPHPVWGATLAACWTGPAPPAQLRAWCLAELPERERPRMFRRFDALPLLASGKLDRAGLRAAVAQRRNGGA